MVLVKLKALYSVLRKDETSESISGELIEYMIDPSPIQRLNRAIDLYLPPIVRIPIDMMSEAHDNIQNLLTYA
jgi:hypothetical protein